jgi:type I restriction enzyme S subunit
MIEFPRYDSYKDSGISWINVIPAHWEIERAKWLFQKMERPVRREDNVVTAFRDGQVTLRTNRRTEGFTNALQEHGYQGIRKGDLVIHAMDAFAGAIGVSDSDGKSTPVYSVCISREQFNVNNYFYAYLLRYMARSGYIQALAKGIRERSTDFRFNDFANLFLPLPSKEEQDRIVAFLDAKTAEIDEAIAKKQRLIELLHEQKAILINRAVTQGLNPSAPLRDSGVPWIGQIPSHWEVKRLKYLLSEPLKYGANEEAKEENLTDPRYIRITDFGDDGVLRKDTYKSLSYAKAKDYLLKDGDILFARSGATVGKSFFFNAFNGQACFAGYLIKATVRSNLISSRFLYLYSKSPIFEAWKCSIFSQATIQNIGADKYAVLPVIVPPLGEQNDIIEVTNAIEMEISGLVENEVTSINYLNELKRVIISEAVTGKIKI